jgi:citrate synthase
MHPASMLPASAMPEAWTPRPQPGPTEGAARKGYATAAEAMQMLDVRQQTLYAYVSRGCIRSIPQPGKKDHLYLREDLERMLTRSRARSGHGAVAAAAMNLGEPIVPTSITEITPAGPRYRGQLAVDLARSQAPFEAVAELLWTGAWNEATQPWPTAEVGPDLQRLLESLPSLQAGEQVVEVFALAVLQLGVRGLGVADCPGSGRTREATRQIIHTLVGCLGLAAAPGRYVAMRAGRSVVEGVLEALALADTQDNREAIAGMLTLIADHELSPGAFTARIAASSGCTLHSCIAAALSTSSGLEVGGLYGRVEEFLSDIDTKGALLHKAVRLQERGIVVPGFVHPLYPAGDPRAQHLIEVAARRSVRSPRLEAALGFLAVMREQFKLLPRHEFAMVMLAREMGLGPLVPAALFAMARTAGLAAHVQEQRLSGSVLRPRAKFMAAA